MNLIYRFLSVSKPLPNANLLVFEGWVFNRIWLHSQIKECIESGNYNTILVVGNKSGDVARQLITGIRSDEAHADDFSMKNKTPNIIFVDMPFIENHWTFSSAIYCRNWVKNHLPEIRRINICTIRYHSRKSWIVYKRVFKGSADIGIISLTTHHKKRTWRFMHPRRIK